MFCAAPAVPTNPRADQPNKRPMRYHSPICCLAVFLPVERAQRIEDHGQVDPLL